MPTKYCGARLVPDEAVRLARVCFATPSKDHDVNLMPLRHEQQPEFWSIVVVESAGSSSEPPSSEFEEVISLADNVGTRGVEVIGPTRSERIEVPFQADPIE
jgi:hypothetical protein